MCQESERGRSLPVAIAVRSWLQRVIIGEGLCPWAEAALNSGALAVVCLLESEPEDRGATSSDGEEVRQRLLQHGELLGRAKPPDDKGATTLALAPRCHGLRELQQFDKALICHMASWEENRKQKAREKRRRKKEEVEKKKIRGREEEEGRSRRI
eukprot:Skav235626  [mRNA]  locus=scaffold358:307632:310705:+ [translate_table: standard]